MPKLLPPEKQRQGYDAERIVRKWYERRADVKRVADCTEAVNGHAALAHYIGDVDIRVEFTDGSVKDVEIKSDRHFTRSKKLFFEALRLNLDAAHESAVTLGWTARSAMTDLAMYSPTDHQLWIVSIAEVRRAFQKFAEDNRDVGRLKDAMREIHTADQVITIGFLLPIGAFESKFEKHDLTRLAKAWEAHCLRKRVEERAAQAALPGMA
jgi:hypothetical protein